MIYSVVTAVIVANSCALRVAKGCHVNSPFQEMHTQRGAKMHTVGSNLKCVSLMVALLTAAHVQDRHRCVDISTLTTCCISPVALLTHYVSYHTFFVDHFSITLV